LEYCNKSKKEDTRLLLMTDVSAANLSPIHFHVSSIRIFLNQKGAEACKDANVMVECRTRLDFSLFMGYRIIVTTVTVMEVAINEVL